MRISITGTDEMLQPIRDALDLVIGVDGGEEFVMWGSSPTELTPDSIGVVLTIRRIVDGQGGGVYVEQETGDVLHADGYDPYAPKP